MKANVYGLDGKITGQIELPEFFSTPVRTDLIKRAVLAFQANRRTPYGTDPLAGKRTSAHYHGSRHLPPAYRMMNRELSRMPRIHSHSPPHLFLTARFVPQAVKGRRAHPPKVEKIWEQKINKKEKILATLSAIAATIVSKFVKERGHKYDGDLPIVVEDEIENLQKTKDVKEFLKKIGLEEELKRAEKKKIRAGKGKMRGRKYKKKKSILFVVSSKDAKLIKSASNIPGVEVIDAKNLNVEHLAPGTHPGRLVIWSKSAIEKLKERFGE